MYQSCCRGLCLPPHGRLQAALPAAEGGHKLELESSAVAAGSALCELPCTARRLGARVQTQPSASQTQSPWHTDSRVPRPQGLRPRPLRRPRHRREPSAAPGPRSLSPAPAAVSLRRAAAARRRPRTGPRAKSGFARLQGKAAAALLSPAAPAELRDAVSWRQATPRLPPCGYRAASEGSRRGEERWGGEGGPCGAGRAARSVGGAARAQGTGGGNKKSETMAGKPKLHYSNGRGRMESIRWLLATAGVEFEEQFIEKKEDLEKLRNDGYLLFQQVPMVEIDGMKMVQTRAIGSYIAAKYNLYGKDLKERAWIDMYVEGTTDLMGMIMYLPFQAADTKEKNLALIIERATTRYFPVYEKALKDHGQDYLVGNKLSWADIHLLEAILMAEECKPDILSAFPLLQAFKGRTSNIPTIKKFLQPGSQRKPPTDEKAVAMVKKIYNI
ncbi:glutathione S-transferase isoform X1 [Strigops habroptila]|nr:glutathione S-transferase isoform X1 [Strigops habroptila]